MLLLFRFVNDFMQAIDIIKAASKTKTKVGPEATEQVKNDVAAAITSVPGMDIQESIEKPLEVMIQLRNLDIVIPTNAATRGALAGQVEHIVLAIPGTAISANLFEDAELPNLRGMLEESFLSNATYKYSGFHDSTGAAQPGPRAGQPQTRPESAMSAAMQHQHPPAAAAASDEAAKGSEAAPAQASQLPLAKRSSKPRQKERPHGVLFFEEPDKTRRKQAGVLHLPLKSDQRRKEGLDGSSPPPEDANVDLEDDILLLPKMLAKRVAGKVVKIVSKDVENPTDTDAYTNKQPSATGPEAVRPLAGESSTSIDAASQLATQQAVERPVPSLAICVDDFQITTGHLVQVPNFFRQVFF